MLQGKAFAGTGAAKATAKATAPVTAENATRVLMRSLLTLEVILWRTLLSQRVSPPRTRPRSIRDTLSCRRPRNQTFWAFLTRSIFGHRASRYFTMMVPFIASFSCGTQV